MSPVTLTATSDGIHLSLPTTPRCPERGAGVVRRLPVRRLRYRRERARPRTLGWSMEAAMNPWIVLLAALVVFVWAWMFDRRRGRREDVTVAVHRAHDRDDARGGAPGGGGGF